MVQSTPQLKPLKIGQLLDRAMYIYRTNFWTLVAMVAVVQIPVGLGTLVTGIMGGQDIASAFTDPTSFAAPATSTQLIANAINVIIALVSSFFLQFVQAAVVFTTARVIFGKRTTVREAYALVRTRWQALIGNYFLLAIAAILAFIWWIVVPCLGWATGLGIIFFLSAVVTPLSVVVIALEGMSPWEAIPRAWNLARSRFWPAFWTAISINIFAQAIVFGPQALISGGLAAVLFDSMSSGSGENIALTVAVSTFATTLIALFVVPISGVGMALLYFDLRLRTEGLDLAMQTVPSAIEPADQAPQPHIVLTQAPRAVTPDGLGISSEFGRFFALSAGFFGIIIGFYALLVGIVFLAVFLVS